MAINARLFSLPDSAWYASLRQFELRAEQRFENVMGDELSESAASKGVGTRQGLVSARTGIADGAAVGSPRITVKLQLDLPGGARIGPGKIRLLELIEEAGSLSRAAEAMHVSYRRAWLFVQQINQAFDEPAVSTPEHGHGGAAARLTDFGKELIRRYRDIELRAEKGSADALSWIASHHKT